VTRRAACNSALIVGLCTSSAALGADDREPIRLTYAADAGCPSASEFEASVLERTRRGRRAGKSEIAREYRIVVRTIGKKSVARLEFSAPSGGTVAREVAAESCAEAARAIAIVAALAFDAAAAGLAGNEGGGEAPASPPGTSPGPVDAGATQDAGEPSPPVAKPGTPGSAPKPMPKPLPPRARRAPSNPEGRGDPARDATPKPAPSHALQVELGARATLTSPKAPIVLPGAELFGTMADPGDMWLLQIGVAGERGFRLESGPGEARFSFVGGRLQGCFFAIALNGGILLSPCVLFEAGAVFAEGFIEGEEATHVDPWYALGLNARLSADLGWATGALEAGPIFPLRPDDQVVFGQVDDPLETVHDVPWIGAFVSLGLTFEVR
jgi:hypothetical protein